VTLVFRLDGGGAVVPMPGGGSVGPGCLVVEHCSADPNFVAQMIKKFVKSDCHINCVDEVQVVSWASVLEAMHAGEGVAAIATIRED
jgi:hypothetical protein